MAAQHYASTDRDSRCSPRPLSVALYARRTAHAARFQPRVGGRDMTLQRMDNVLIVVDDLEAAKAFFVELGMELDGEMPVEGRWVDLVVGLENVRCEIAMMRTPDGHGRLELTKFHTPAAVRAEPKNAPVNTLRIRRIMFAVDDIEDVLARLRAHGADLVGGHPCKAGQIAVDRVLCRADGLRAVRHPAEHGP